MLTICLHTALLFRLAWCACMCECGREKEQRCTPKGWCAHAHTHTLYTSLFIYTCLHTCPVSGQGHCQMKARLLPDYRGTTQHLHSEAYKTNQPQSHIPCSYTSKKVESLEAQRRSALAQCLVSHHIQRLMLE